MPKKSGSNSRIEVLFPIVLFLIFTMSALIVILFAARIYQSTIEESAIQYRDNISASYITQKIRQSDTSGSVGIGELDGCKALTLKSSIEGDEYITYIYAYDGAVRELFTSSADNKNNFSAGSGMVIFEASDMSLSYENNNLLTIDITDSDGDIHSTKISIKSDREETP